MINTAKYRIISHTQIWNITSLQGWRLSTLYVYCENNTVVRLCVILVCAAHVLASAATCVSQLFLYHCCSQRRLCCPQYGRLSASSKRRCQPATCGRSVNSYAAALLRAPRFLGTSRNRATRRYYKAIHGKVFSLQISPCQTRAVWNTTAAILHYRR